MTEATVTDVNDPEELGRVKIRYLRDDMVSEWCRVSQFYAGPDSAGCFFMPEVDSEVIVAFIHGEFRTPIVLGCLYNGVDKPATHRDQERDEKQILTRAGHRITLVDTEGEEKIVVVDKSTKLSIEISTKDNAITIKADGGSMSLEAKEISIKADEALNIEASQISHKASSSISSEAPKIDGKASGEMTLTGMPINLN